MKFVSKNSLQLCLTNREIGKILEYNDFSSRDINIVAHDDFFFLFGNKAHLAFSRNIKANVKITGY